MKCPSLFYFLMVALAPAAGLASDFYLGSSASSQPGIAVKSIAALNSLDLQPGDRVFFEGGETFPGTIDLVAGDAGTPEQPVLITSYGTGRATVHGGAGSAVRILNASGFIFRNINLQGSGPTMNNANGVDAGVYLADDTKLPFLRFEQMAISGFGRGVLIWSWYTTSTRAWPGFTDVKLTGLDVHDNLRGGIETSGTTLPDGDGTRFSHTDFVIAHCSVYGNHGDPASTQHSGSGIIVGGVDRATIEYCVAHDNGGLGPATGGGPFGIWAWEARAATIQYNLVYNQKSSSSLDGGAYDLDGGCSNSVVQYNYSYNNEGPAIGLIQFSDASPHMNSVVRYNISENDCRKNTQGIFYVGEFSEPYGINGADIYGNTFFVSTNAKAGKPPLVKVENNDDISGIRLRNNLFIATHDNILISGSFTTPSRVLLQGNNYWGGSIDLTKLRVAGQEMLDGMSVGSRVDPQLVSAGGGGKPTDALQLPTISAYLLSANSPLIGKGLNLAQRFGITPGAQDFYGVPLTTSLSIGASAYPTAADPASKSTTPSPTTSSSSVLLDDQFNGSGSMSGRTADTFAPMGQRWTIETGTGTLGSGLCSANTTFRTVIGSGTSDGAVETRIQLTTASTGLIVRSSDSLNYFRVLLNPSSLVIQKTQAGVTSTLTSVSRPFGLGTTYNVRVTLNGPALAVEIDGVVAANVSSSFNQTATRHGLLAANSGIRKWEYFTVRR
jgi:hypothetical protein